MVFFEENTRVTEAYAYFLLKDKLFGEGAHVTVGDKPALGLPDIYTNNKYIGIEVTCVEEPHVYALLNKLIKNPLLKRNNFDYINMKFEENRVKRAHLFDKDKLKYSLANQAYEKSSRKGFLKEMNRMIEKKFSNLNERNAYNACKHNYLFLVSDHITKNFINIDDYENACLNISKKYDKKFDGVFVALNDNVYFIDKSNTTFLFLDKEETWEVRQKTQYQHLEQPTDSPKLQYVKMKTILRMNDKHTEEKSKSLNGNEMSF